MIKKIIMGLEDIGYFVVAVTTDNLSLNQKAMSFFAKDGRVSPVYLHVDYYFVIDSVHILKCIWNNWLNQMYAGNVGWLVGCIWFYGTKSHEGHAAPKKEI